MATIEEVLIAKQAFSFLLDRYVAEVVPDTCVSDYLRQMINSRMNGKEKEETPKVMHVPAQIARAKQAQIQPVHDPLMEAKEHILNCILTSQPINRVKVADLTGYSTSDIERFINGTISEKHGIAAKKIEPKKTRKPFSEETKARMAAGQAARYARLRADRGD